VEINGTPLVSSDGYSDLSSYTPGAPDTGVWHMCVAPGPSTPPTHTYPASFTYSGCGYIDDIVVTNGPVSFGGPSVNNASGANNISSNAALLWCDLVSTGAAPTDAWIYWGTSDGGTTPGSWDTNSFFPSMPNGTFSNYVAGLSPSTMYYYRCYASNSFGGAWAPATKSFITDGDRGIIEIWSKGYNADVAYSSLAAWTDQ
jgi:hypothetical protein